ncbi:MAG: DUF2797 domain-containing protein [Vicingaceae bacterium]
MKSKIEDEVQYFLPVGDETIPMNELIDRVISFHYQKNIYCVSCGKKTPKSYNQGFCYKCMINAPEAAECIIHPEKCQAHLGIGRDMEWERTHHLQEHFVYLSLTSGVKVGVTRSTQIPTRWIDQGASEAIKMAATPNRYLAGLIEVNLKKHFNDKTNWRAMLQNVIKPTDLLVLKNKAYELVNEDLRQYFNNDSEIFKLNYPVKHYPVKVKSYDFDKIPDLKMKLKGIKGQYLIFENDIVFNVRKYTGYEFKISF